MIGTDHQTRAVPSQASERSPAKCLPKSAKLYERAQRVNVSVFRLFVTRDLAARNSRFEGALRRKTQMLFYFQLTDADSVRCGRKQSSRVS